MGKDGWGWRSKWAGGGGGGGGWGVGVIEKAAIVAGVDSRVGINLMGSLPIEFSWVRDNGWRWDQNWIHIWSRYICGIDWRKWQREQSLNRHYFDTSEVQMWTNKFQLVYNLLNICSLRVESKHPNWLHVWVVEEFRQSLICLYRGLLNGYVNKSFGKGILFFNLKYSLHH